MYSFYKKGCEKVLKKVKPFVYKALRFLYTKNKLMLFSIHGKDIENNNSIIIQKQFHILHVNNKDDVLVFKNDEFYEIILNEIEKGATAYLVVSNNQVCHYSFVKKNNAYVGEIKRNIILKNQSSYIYNCFTHKDFRGKKLYYLTLLTILSEYRDSPDGYTIASLDWNSNSISVIKKTGFLPSGYCTFLTLLGVSKFVNSTPYAFKK